jgi:hypothetical protein
VSEKTKATDVTGEVEETEEKGKKESESGLKVTST